MVVSSEYREFVLESLGRVAPAVTARSMFGGVGVYSAGLFFALMAGETLYLKVDDTNRGDFEAIGMGPFRPFDDDTLYLKVDDTNRGDFESRGMGPFQPYGDGTPSMQYYPLPEEIFEDPAALGEWVGRAVDVARRAKATRGKGKGDTKGKRASAKRTPQAKGKRRPR